MFEITIDSNMKNAAPSLLLGCIYAQITVTEQHEALWRELTIKEQTLTTLDLGQVGAIPQIHAQREAYRKAGKNPGRYRGSSEALIRRIVQGKGLSQVNNLVDVNNLISLETFNPVGCYDCSKLVPPVVCQIGEPGEVYEGIGKGEINLENLPLLADGAGPFGSPTSDSSRSAVSLDTQELLMVIFAFEGTPSLEQAMLDRASGLLQRYASATELEAWLVS